MNPALVSKPSGQRNAAATRTFVLLLLTCVDVGMASTPAADEAKSISYQKRTASESPSLHGQIARTFVSFSPVDYGWDRRDSFRNNSSSWAIRIESISGYALDPEELGFSDVSGNPGNWPQVAATAAAQHPEWHYWGGCWWVDINPPRADWSPPTCQAEGKTLPFVLQPGESFVLQTQVRGNVGPQSGEAAIGWCFSGIVVPTGGSIEGAVYDSSSGDPLPGVNVLCSFGSSVTSGLQGNFRFDQVAAGQCTLTFSKPGYVAATRQVTVSAGGGVCVFATLATEPPDPGLRVTEVQSRFTSPETSVFFLNAVPLTESFTAKVDWGTYSPGKIRWITPTGTYDDQVSGNTATRAFNMGTEFGAGGKLKVVAVASGGTPISREYQASFDVIPPPPVLDLAPSALITANTDAGSLQYNITGMNGTTVTLAEWDDNRIPASIPFFGGQKMQIGAEVDLQGVINGDGRAELFSFGIDGQTKKVIRKGIPCRKGMKLPFVELEPKFGLEVALQYQRDLQAWRPTGSIELGVTTNAKGPQVPLSMLTGIPFLHALYVRGDFELALALNGSIAGWSQDGPLYEADFQFEPLAKAVLGAGAASFAYAEVWGGGGFHAGVNLYPDVQWQDPYVILLVGHRVVTFSFELSSGEKRWYWPESAPAPILSWTDALRNGPCRLIPRDYLDPKPIQLDAARRAVSSGTEGVIDAGVYPYSTPTATRVGPNVLACWITDDPTRDAINRTELTFAEYAGTSWTPAPVADDGTADTNPQLAKLPNGNAVAVWEDVNAVLTPPLDPNDSAQVSQKFEEMKSRMEIATSVYDATAKVWTPAVRLTSDSVFDRSPQVSAAASNDVLVVWVRNEANDLSGSSTAPNSLMWSRFDGSAWSAPGVIATGLGLLPHLTVAYNGTTATVVYSTDADDNLDTLDDQELWDCVLQAGTWSAPARLTSDTQCDANPKLLYDQAGTLRLFWLRNNAIRCAAGLDVANSVLAVSSENSAGVRDFEVISSDSGQQVLVWTDVSNTHADLWEAYRDPVLNLWSTPRQLTSDDSLERFLTGVFDASGNLFCIYDKTHTAYQDRVEQLPDGRWVTIPQVPMPAQSDLCYLTHSPGTDLAVAVDTVHLNPPNPLPESAAVIDASIENQGEKPASNISVAFYDGDPASGGVLIGTKTLIAPLGGGQNANVSQSWVVPSVARAHDIYVVVDPAMVQPDRDRSNNSCSFRAVAAELTITSLASERVGPGEIITARIVNAGCLAAGSFEASLRDGNESGAPIGSVTVSGLPAGAYKDISFAWQPPLGQEAVACIIVDPSEAVDEFDEVNNSRMLRIELDTDRDGVVNSIDQCPSTIPGVQVDATGCPTPVPGDFDRDGDVDAADLDLFRACASGPAVPYPTGCDAKDLDHDNDVDQSDFGIFQRCLSGENIPAASGCAG